MRGKVREGSLTSSTMLTESSKPTIAKNATVVAMVIARNADFSPGVSKTTTRPTSPSPLTTAHAPMAMITVSATTTTEVSTTLSFTLSPTPRRLTAARTIMKPSATARVAPVPVGTPPRRLSRPSSRLEATSPEDVEALVMPEQTTAKATRKVRKWVSKALWTNNAAPAACGCRVTSSR